jgi:hypothetical protein
MEHLYFYSLLPGSKPWGYWSADDTPKGPQDFKDSDVTISSVAYVYFFLKIVRHLQVLMNHFS